LCPSGRSRSSSAGSTSETGKSGKASHSVIAPGYHYGAVHAIFPPCDFCC
jgi:hypothetical protein